MRFFFKKQKKIQKFTKLKIHMKKFIIKKFAIPFVVNIINFKTIFFILYLFIKSVQR